ncbi:MAG: hypothetical protein AB1522_02175 [Chloroflexota bacterium]
MKNAIRILSIIVFLSLLVGFSYTPVEAGGRCPTFIAHVTHGIDGTKLGLSQKLPVIVFVYFGPDLKLVHKFELSFKQSHTAELPAGMYLFKVYSVELKKFIHTMTVGPVKIPGCLKVGLHAKLWNGVPVIDVVVRELVPD